jgi:hypothetical protein
MSELGAEAQALIESARSGDQPSAADRERMRGKLVAELGAAAFASAVVASTAASAGATSVPASGATASSGMFGALKLALAALVVGAVGAGALLGLRSEPVAKPRAPVPVAAPAAPQAEPSPAPVVTPLVAPAAPVQEPASRPARARPRPIESKPAVPAAAPAASSPNTLTEELALLSRAQTALRSGQAEQALQLVREHEQRFAQGALVQERLGITALARCALGGDTSQVVSELSRAAPGSPMLERVREACAKK